MQLAIKKWGNSAGIRIPVSILSALKLQADQMVDMKVEEGKIIIEPIQPHYSLDKLLAGITPQNVHQEISTYQSMGKEEA